MEYKHQDVSSTCFKSRTSGWRAQLQMFHSLSSFGYLPCDTVISQVINVLQEHTVPPYAPQKAEYPSETSVTSYWPTNCHSRSEILAPVVTLLRHSSVQVHRCFGGRHCFHLHGTQAIPASSKNKQCGSHLNRINTCHTYTGRVKPTLCLSSTP